MVFNIASQSCILSVIHGMVKTRILKTYNPRIISMFKKPLHLLQENTCTDNLNVTESSCENIALEKINILTKALGISVSNAIQIIANNKKLLKHDNERLEVVSNFLINKFNVDDIFRNSKVLTIAPYKTEQYYAILQELGFTTQEITPSKLMQLPCFLKKNRMELKNEGLIPSTFDPLENMLNVINANENLRANVKENLNYLSKEYDFISLIRLRHTVLCCFLAGKLELTLEGVNKLMDQHPGLKYQSLHNLSLTLDKLKDIGLSRQKMSSTLYLIARYFYKFDTFLEMKELHGIPITEIISRNPSLIATSPKNALEIEKILERNNVKKTQILAAVRIHNLSAETVSKRFESIQKISEFRLQKNSPQFLKLLTSYHRAESRLSELQSLGFNSISLACLIGPIKQYRQKLVCGYDRTLGIELIYYLKGFFNTSFEVTRKQLYKHPKCTCSFNIVNADMVINYLLESGATKEQLWNSLSVLLYCHKVVSETFEKMKNFPELQPFSEWRDHPLFLDLIIYYIERPNRFEGYGVFIRQ